jgi:hypothetical protein
MSIFTRSCVRIYTHRTHIIEYKKPGDTQTYKWSLACFVSLPLSRTHAYTQQTKKHTHTHIQYKSNNTKPAPTTPSLMSSASPPHILSQNLYTSAQNSPQTKQKIFLLALMGSQIFAFSPLIHGRVCASRVFKGCSYFTR